jgi:hypothetical protein
LSTTSQRKRIPIEDGVFTFGTGYEIGLRLNSASRFIHKYVPTPQQGAPTMGPIFEDQTWEPLELDDTTMTPLEDSGPVFCAERFDNPEAGIGGAAAGCLVGGQSKLTGKGTIWKENGLKVFTAAGVGPFRSIVTWTTLATPTIFAGGINQPMVQSTNRTTFTPYTPAGITGLAEHFLVYQERLWFSQGKRVYFTDILDPYNIRQFGQTNPIVVPMNVKVLARVGVSDIDPSAQSHLFIGGNTQTWILDGSPGSGNQVLRRYTSQLGVFEEHHVASTSIGLFFFGSDRMIYWVKPGALGDPDPIGLPVRDLLAPAGPVAIFWRRPYLCVVLLKCGTELFLDMSQDKAKWWGPTARSGFIEPMAVGNRYPSNPWVWLIGTDPNVIGAGDTSFIMQYNDPDVLNPVSTTSQDLTTGFLYEPGHEVVLRKVHATVKQGTIDKVFTITSTDSVGGTISNKFTSKTGTKILYYQIPMEDTQGVNFGSRYQKGLRGDFLILGISCKGREDPYDLGMSALQNWEVEYDIVKRDKP